MINSLHYCNDLEDQYATMEMDKNDVVNLLALTFVAFSGDEITMGPTSPIVKHAANITARQFCHEKLFYHIV